MRLAQSVYRGKTVRTTRVWLPLLLMAAVLLPSTLRAGDAEKAKAAGTKKTKPVGVEKAKDVTQGIVWREKDGFGGWPANEGLLWTWGNEMLVGFQKGKYKRAKAGHSVRGKVSSVLVRSMDSGVTWGAPIPFKSTTSNVPAVNFKHPSFAMIAKGQNYYLSYDRGVTWYGAFNFPSVKEVGKQTSRTDYIVTGKLSMFAFLSGSPASGGSSSVFVVHTADGGASWQFRSWLHKISPKYWHIQPSSVRLAGGRLVTAVRNHMSSIRTYLSDDDGRTWREGVNITAVGDPKWDLRSPPAMVLLKDGRIALTYASRTWRERGMRARISSDGGETWGNVLSIRDGSSMTGDSTTWDMGYPRSAQRKDGKIVTVYYYNTPDPVTKKATDIHIAYSIWSPGKIEKVKDPAKPEAMKPEKKDVSP